MIGRLFATLLVAVSVSVVPIMAEAQTPRVGLLSIGTDPTRPKNWEPFVEEMSRRGYVDGRTITFERRFKPGAQPDSGDLQPGETLIGGQVMALGIDPRGEVQTCKIVSESGSMRPQYGCAEAATERFEASAA